MRRIAEEAKRQDLDFVLDREGAKHTIYVLDGVVIPISRHREVNERTTEGIYRECQDKLGKGWWRR